MPKVKVRGHERFRCEDPEEVKIVEKAHEKYCHCNHDNYDFVKEFFGDCSCVPGQYIRSFKRGCFTTSIESWLKLKEYASK